MMDDSDYASLFGDSSDDEDEYKHGSYPTTSFIDERKPSSSGGQDEAMTASTTSLSNTESMSQSSVVRASSSSSVKINDCFGFPKGITKANNGGDRSGSDQSKMGVTNNSFDSTTRRLVSDIPSPTVASIPPTTASPVVTISTNKDHRMEAHKDLPAYVQSKDYKEWRRKGQNLRKKRKRGQSNKILNKVEHILAAERAATIIPPPQTQLPPIPPHLKYKGDESLMSLDQLVTQYSGVYTHYAAEVSSFSNASNHNNNPIEREWAVYHRDLSARAAHHYNNLLTKRKNSESAPSVAGMTQLKDLKQNNEQTVCLAEPSSCQSNKRQKSSTTTNPQATIWEGGLKTEQTQLEGSLLQPPPPTHQDRQGAANVKQEEDQTASFNLKSYATPEELCSAVTRGQLKRELIRLGMKWEGRPIERAERLWKTRNASFNLQSYATPEQLCSAVSHGQVKRELKRLGMKWEGRPIERVERLWKTRDVPLNTLPAELFVGRANPHPHKHDQLLPTNDGAQINTETIQHRRKVIFKRVDKEPITMRYEIFRSLSLEDKHLVLGYPPSPYDHNPLPKHLPFGSMGSASMKRLIPIPKRLAAAKRALEATNQKFTFQNESCNHEQDPPSTEQSCKDPNKRHKSYLLYVDFITSLPYCYLFDMSFWILGQTCEDTHFCWCPCGSYMHKWRKFFGLIRGIKGVDQMDTAFDICGKKRNDPNGLMAHLRKRGEVCPFHYGVVMYVEGCYEDFNGPGLAHKAIYQNRDDKMYQRAMGAENAMNRRLYTLMKKDMLASKEREERMRKQNAAFQKRMDSLGKVNKEQRQRLEELDLLLKKLGLEKEEDDADITERDYDSFRMVLQNCINVVKTKPKSKKKISIKFSVENNFSLQSLLTDLDERDSKDNSFLLRNLSFRNDPHFHAPKLIVDWIITIGEAIDEGGPTKHFFSEVWAQLETLKVSALGLEVNLFEKSSVGVVPNSNEKIRCSGRGGIDSEAVDLVVEKAKRFYRAIGRIMCHSLVRGFVISSTVMPSFYRNVIFRECDLQDNRYKHKKIIEDLEAMGQISNLNKMMGMDMSMLGVESDEKVTIDNFIPKVLYERFIVQRSIAINSLKEGLTLDGYANFSTVLRIMPEKAVSSLLFAPPETKVADVLKVLKPLSLKDGVELAQINNIQELFFEDVFKTVLEEKTKEDDSFLSDFLFFATALTFLPHSLARPGYEIVVEFHSIIADREYRPQSKTCANTLILPYHAYDCDKELFNRLLTESLLEMKANNFTDD